MKKTVNKIILACVAALAGSCADEYKENYSLSINADNYIIEAEEGRLPVMVYASDNWTATLVSGSEWAELSVGSGRGVSTIHLLYGENTGLSRLAEIVLRSAGLERTIQVVQKSSILAPHITFEKDELHFANGAYGVRAAVNSNLSETLFTDLVPQIVFDPQGEEWIKDITYVAAEEVNGQMIPRGFVFKTEPNTGGQSRTAQMMVSLTDAEGNVVGDTLTLTQSHQAAYITLADDTVPFEEITGRSLAMTSNLGAVLEEVTMEVVYDNPAAADFISELALAEDAVTYSIAKNETMVDRIAYVNLSYTDLEGILTMATATITQGIEAQPQEIAMTQLRAAFGATETEYTSPVNRKDYIVLRVIGEASNPNMDQNVNTAANSINTDENDRTNYAQTEDGSMGIRLKFALKQDNTGARYDKIRIWLDGATMLRESDPVRYTLKNLTSAHVVVESAGTASDLPEKTVSVGALADNDVYTYRTVQNLEFSVKDGAYTNVREYDAILNPYNDGVTYASASQAQKAKDGAANLLYDNDNNAIYMLVNMNCQWRRTGGAVPQGVGPVSGIVVHTPMERWGGNVGKYSIRPFDETDIAIATAYGSQFNTLAEWKLDKGTISVGQYRWNDAAVSGGYTVGNATNSATQLVQNKLHATTNSSGGDALLYSENRMLNQSETSDRSYPVAIYHGYRGLDVSTYTTGSILTGGGGSQYTVLAFMGNVAGWYEWDGEVWNGKTNGIVMEFTTTGISGSTAAVSFSTAAGKHSTSEANCSWTNASSFPVYWRVEYAVSTDGTTWSDYSEAKNAATGNNGFEMRSLPWCINNGSTRLSLHDSANTAGVYTQSDFGFGFVPYRFILPAEIFGKSLVRVRITPSSDVIATWNAGENNYNLGQTYRNAKITKTYNTNLANAIYLEDISIQYK